MKFNSFRFILLSSLIVFLNSCLGTTADTTVISSDASFVSLTFAKNDSIPNIQNAVFTLDVNGKTIENIDSLPFNSRIDSVYPTFSFTSSARSFLHITIDQGFKFTKGKKDSVQITGKDTVDFRQPLIRVSNFATDGKSYKSYTIKLNVHKVQPELYIWGKVSENLDSRNIISQKAIILNDIIKYYVYDGATTYLYSSIDGNIWSTPTIVTGLPINPLLGDMTQFNGKLYLTQNDDMIYSTSNGTDWAVKSIPDYNFKSLLYTLNDSIYAITQSIADQKYRFASSKNGLEWLIRNVDTIPENFPVSDFTPLSFASRTGKPKAIVLGGKDRNGVILKSNWSTEGSIINGKTYWINLSTENKLLDSISSGSSLIAYDNKLFLFGKGININGSKNHFRQSIDEGLTWQKPDSTYNYLPVGYEPRNYQSVVALNAKTYNKVNSVDLKDEIIKSNRIFIIGGKTGSTILSDVWTGKLNRKNFLRQ